VQLRTQENIETKHLLTNFSGLTGRCRLLANDVIELNKTAVVEAPNI